MTPVHKKHPVQVLLKQHEHSTKSLRNTAISMFSNKMNEYTIKMHVIHDFGKKNTLKVQLGKTKF